MSFDKYLDGQLQAVRKFNNEQIELRERRLLEVEAENAALRAELESLRPKPVVTIDNSFAYRDATGIRKLEFTLYDGKLVRVEVLDV